MPDFLAVNRELPAEAEAEAKPVQERADALFWSGVLAANAAHVPGTACLASGHEHKCERVRCAQFGLRRGARREHPP